MQEPGACSSSGILLSTGALAQDPRRSAIALGDCNDAQLRISARSFNTALIARLPESPQAMTEVLRSLRPQATKSLDELKRQLDVADTQFYNANYSMAAEQVVDALAELEHVEPSPARWELQVQARLLQTLIFRGVMRTAKAEEASSEEFRLSPDYQLDTNFFSPSVTSFFNRVRRQVRAANKARLIVTSSPPGADVYLDGRIAGKTPFTGSFLPGAYQLQLDGERHGWSFPRNIQLGREHDTVVTVDLLLRGCGRRRGPALSRPPRGEPRGPVQERGEVRSPHRSGRGRRPPAAAEGRRRRVGDGVAPQRSGRADRPRGQPPDARIG